MNAHSTFETNGVTIKGPLPLVSVGTTNWGYVIRADVQLARRAALIERVCLATGMAFLVMAFVSWMVPTGYTGPQVQLSNQIAATFGLAMPAFLFIWIAERGLSRDVEVDLVHSQLRMCVSNRNGRARTVKAIAFDDIGSAYIKKKADFGCQARLYLRLKGNKGVVELAHGRETTMRVLHERLSLELRPQRIKLRGWERVGRRIKPAQAMAKAS